MSRYANIEKVIQRLVKRLGKDRVVVEAEDLELYAHDETEDFFFLPSCAVLPRETHEIEAIVQIALEEKVPIVPRGGGTGLAGGALPVQGGIVLSLEKMNRILEIDAANSCVVVEPGVVTQTLQESVEKKGWYYPPDPSSRGSCLIGGNVATNASGPACLKYGSTRHYCLGIEAITGKGTLFQSGGKIRKSSTGLDMTSLLVGSEGTLAIFTEIVLKLIQPPEKKRTFFFSFSKLSDCFAFMERVLQKVPQVAICEFMEREAMEVAEASKGLHFPSKGAGALLVELHFLRAEDEELPLREISTFAESFAGCEAALAEGAQREKLWDLRRITGEAVKQKAPYKEDDCVVPRASLLPLLKAIESAERETGLSAICYGHAGDGNLHVNILKENLSDELWQKKRDAFESLLFQACLELGGTISGEHGIGWVQRKHAQRFLPKEQILLMRKIKAFFDPEGILNPGKVLLENSR